MFWCILTYLLLTRSPGSVIIGHIRGQCYDGAADMSGRFQGVQAKISQKQPHASYIHKYIHTLLKPLLEFSIARLRQEGSFGTLYFPVSERSWGAN